MYILNKRSLRRNFIYGEKAEKRCEKQSMGKIYPIQEKQLKKRRKG
jgi:hypothetical protein